MTQAQPLASDFILQLQSRQQCLHDYNLPWLHDMRRQGLARFTNIGIPGIKHEHWKYTHTTPIAQKTDWETTPNIDINIDWFSNAASEFDRAGLTCNRLVFVNGSYSADLSQLKDNDASGLTISSLTTALTNHTALIKQHLNKLPNETAFPYAAINTGLLEQGAFIHVPKNTQLSNPIHILFLSTKTERALSVHPRLLMVAEDNSQVDVIEHHRTTDSDSKLFTNCINEIFLQPGAQCRYIKINDDATAATHTGATYIQQNRNSHFTAHALCLGGGFVRNDLHVRLAGPGASCDLNGVYAPNNSEHVDNHTTIEHIATHCSSHERYKGLIFDQAHAVFNGRIYIHPGAQKSDAALQNKNLLLSSRAEVDTKPELEIYADDVKCSHGATIGQLNHQQVYYLQSRGINQHTAKTLLSMAFINEMIDKIPFAVIQTVAKTKIEARLNDKENTHL